MKVLLIQARAGAADAAPDPQHVHARQYVPQCCRSSPWERFMTCYAHVTSAVDPQRDAEAGCTGLSLLLTGMQTVLAVDATPRRMATASVKRVRELAEPQLTQPGDYCLVQTPDQAVVLVAMSPARARGHRRHITAHRPSPCTYRCSLTATASSRWAAACLTTSSCCCATTRARGCRSPRAVCRCCMRRYCSSQSISSVELRRRVVLDIDAAEPDMTEGVRASVSHHSHMQSAPRWSGEWCCCC